MSKPRAELGERREYFDYSKGRFRSRVKVAEGYWMRMNCARADVAAAEGWEAIEGKVVHHVDGNRYNDEADNLVAVTPDEHRRLHAGMPRRRSK